MATTNFFSPLLRLPLAVPLFYLAFQLGVCDAVQRQSPLTMSTVFPGPDGSGRGSVHVDSQCADPIENETGMGVIASSREDSSSSDQPHKRAEAQRCLLSSSASLMRQQQHLAPEAEHVACATKHLMAAAPPHGITFFQKQEPGHGHRSQQKISQVEEHQQESHSQQYRQRREAHADSNSRPNIAFDWRNAVVSNQRPQGTPRVSTAAALTDGESAVTAIPREKQASAAASGGDTENHQISFSEALSHAAAGEAAALAGGAWDWSTWGLGGLYQSLPSAVIKKETSRRTSTADAAEDVKRAAAADAQSVVAPAAAPAATGVAAGTTAFSVPEAPATAPAETESAAAVAVPPPGARFSTASLPAGNSAVGALVENHGAAAGEQQQQSAEAAAAEKTSSSKSSNKSSWWGGGKTWRETIGSFFRKLDKRIEDAQGVLSHGDMYEFSL